jgi:hypothetical protein
MSTAPTIRVMQTNFGWQVVTTRPDLRTELVAVAPTEPLARRIAHLVHLYGLDDTPIPDTPGDIT